MKEYRRLILSVLLVGAGSYIVWEHVDLIDRYHIGQLDCCFIRLPESILILNTVLGFACFLSGFRILFKRIEMKKGLIIGILLIVIPVVLDVLFAS